VFGALSANAWAAEVIRVSGKGEAPIPAVKRDKEIAAANQRALVDAEELAKRKALAQAVFQVYGNREALGTQADAILAGVVDNSAALILDKNVTSAGVQGGMAVVEMVVQVDGKALREYLEANFTISSAMQTEGRFRIYVLSYTLEGMDPNRAQPQVLREEVTDNQKDIHSSNYAAARVDAAAQASSTSVQGSATSTSKGEAGYKADAAAQNSAGAKARASESGSAKWDEKQSATVDARQTQASSAYSSSAKSGASRSDTSRYFHRVVEYADPTKKGAALSNEVRAEIEGMMTTAGFDVATLNVSMMNREFPTEDDLVNAVLNEMRQNADVKPEDYVAIALNSFTPVNVETHQFTSKVTYRVVKIRDGLALLPAKDITGDSGERAASDDVARTYAVKSAMLKVDEILPREIKQAVQKIARAEQREAVASATTYVIQVDNAASMTASLQVRSALSAAGFGVNRSYNGQAKTDTLTVSLNGKSGQDVMAAIESLMDRFDVQVMDEKSARIKVK
jgi:hypothetical protein